MQKPAVKLVQVEDEVISKLVERARTKMVAAKISLFICLNYNENQRCSSINYQEKNL